MTESKKRVLKASNWKEHITAEEKKNMISAVAYGIAEERGFENFSVEVDPQRDWLQAEEEVDQFLADKN